jgi:two-component system, NtrC family, response regulator AtoC
MSVTLSGVPALTRQAGIVFGCSNAILPLNAAVEDIARTDIPVLLQGDSGTGKEVYARYIHWRSARHNKPLTKLNGALLNSAQLLANFGGSAPSEGAEGPDRGSGTLFLDGLDELGADCQRMLLSFLQAQESDAVGAARVRLISTTTRNLQREAELGRFRRELYFRIAGACLRLPQLKERREDIPGLVEFFLEKHSSEMGRKTPTLSDDEMELLMNYDWPGNIRELANLARKIVALGETKFAIAEISYGSSPRQRTVGPQSQSLKAAARSASRMAERDLIMKALEKTHWNRKQAAKQLQISYKALLYKIKQMDVPRAELQNEGEER